MTVGLGVVFGIIVDAFNALALRDEKVSDDCKLAYML